VLARLPASSAPSERWLDRAARGSQQLGAALVPWGSPDYPPSLAELSDAPPVLARARRPRAARPHAVAIVGSRAASAYGREVARRVAVSSPRRAWSCRGLAFGIDAARTRRRWRRRHDDRGAGVRASTASTGRAPRRLAERIARGGAVVTEFALGVSPRPRLLPVAQSA
jgi:DNA processing protein